MAWRGTCAGLRTRPELPRNLTRFLVAAGATVACWLLGMLLSATAHAEEAPGAPTEDSDEGLLSVVRTESADPATLVSSADGDGSGLLGPVTGTVLGTVEQAAAGTGGGDENLTGTVRNLGDTVTGLADGTSETAQAGVDDVTTLLPTDPADPPAQSPREPVTPDGPAPEIRDAPRQPPQPDPDVGGEAPAVRTTDTAPPTTELDTPQPAEPQAANGQGDIERVRTASNPSTSSGATAGDTTPAPEHPTLPSPPSTPAGPVGGTTHLHDSSPGGKHHGVLSSLDAAPLRWGPAATADTAMPGEASGTPALPGAAPD